MNRLRVSRTADATSAPTHDGDNPADDDTPSNLSPAAAALNKSANNVLAQVAQRVAADPKRGWTAILDDPHRLKCYMLLSARSRTDYDQFLLAFPEDLERIRSQYPNRPSSNTPSIPPAYMAGLVRSTDFRCNAFPCEGKQLHSPLHLKLTGGTSMNTKLLCLGLWIATMTLGATAFAVDAPGKPGAPAAPAKPGAPAAPAAPGSPGTLARPARIAPPARDPHTAGYVEAKELEDRAVPPVDVDGSFIIGPTHTKAPELAAPANGGAMQGKVFNLTMKSSDSKIYPGIAREQGTFGTVNADNPAKLIVTTSHAAPYTRKVAVYVPTGYVAGTAAPFIVGADGPDKLLFTALDNLIAANKVPAMVAISIGNGSGDAQGSQRGLEYDTMSGLYAEFVESEVLPLVEKECGVKLTKDPEGRATMGCSSGGSCAMIMAWYHPEWYHRVLTFSGTYVNQQWPYNEKTPGGAWELHKTLIPNSDAKPLRIWMEVGDRDLLNPNIMRDDMHDWVLANENMAKALAGKGYHYQFVFARNAGHCDGSVKQQTLPEALEYVWKGYAGK